MSERYIILWWLRGLRPSAVNPVEIARRLELGEHSRLAATSLPRELRP